MCVMMSGVRATNRKNEITKLDADQAEEEWGRARAPLDLGQCGLIVGDE